MLNWSEEKISQWMDSLEGIKTLIPTVSTFVPLLQYNTPPPHFLMDYPLLTIKTL